MQPLDIYAACEPLLELEEPTQQLHDIFLTTLKQYPCTSLIDLGCGNGAFLQRVKAQLGYQRLYGVDASKAMCDATQLMGFSAVPSLDEIDESVDCITAVFDVLNFIDSDSLYPLFASIAAHLNDDGLFIADINTDIGFVDVAPGQFFAQNGHQHISIEATYDEDIGELRTVLHYFKANSQACTSFNYFQGVITQYNHQLKRLKEVGALTLVDVKSISLYAEGDKALLLFKKSVKQG